LIFFIDIAVLLSSLAFLLTSAWIVTEYVQELSVQLSVPLFVLGLITAIGTCLPELSFALRAVKKNHGEVGVGNVVGNVLADSLLTIGIVALIQPIKPEFPTPPLVTGFVMVLSALFLVFVSKKGVVRRMDGVLLLIVFVLFFFLQSVIEGLGI
jgi:cation:H+ antiporter